MNDWCPKCGTYHEQTTAGTCPENLEDKLFLGTYAEGHDAGYRAGVEASKAERDKLRRLLRELREALEKYGKRGHYYCDDSWYSCPKAEEGCANGDAGEECNCGADKVNAEVDTILWRRSHER